LSGTAPAGGLAQLAALRFTPLRTATVESFLSAAFSSLRLVVSSRMMSSWPSDSAQAIRVLSHSGDDHKRGGRRRHFAKFVTDDKIGHHLHPITVEKAHRIVTSLHKAPAYGCDIGAIAPNALPAVYGSRHYVAAGVSQNVPKCADEPRKNLQSPGGEPPAVAE
jgi:hypothetical protein